MKSTIITFLVLSTLTFNVVSAQNHFQPIWSSPYLPMNIYVTQADLSVGGSLGVGDEIGIFDGENCVGATVLSGPIEPLDPLAMIVSKDDPTTPEIDGFIEGNPISYKFWISVTSTEVGNVAAQYNIGDGTFVSQGTAVIELEGTLIVNVNSNKDKEYSYRLLQNYPNPFNLTTTIEYGISEDSNVSLVIYNLLGEEVMILVKERQLAGWYKEKFNAINLPSGVYLYRITANEFNQSKKFILMK